MVLVATSVGSAARQGGRLESGEVGTGEEMGQGVERVLPRVALVRHVALQDRDGHRLALPAPVLEAARQRCDVGEGRLLGQEPSDLELWVDAFLEPPEDLQHQPLSEDHRVVALLGDRQLRL